jgi:hypothetical protein
MANLDEPLAKHIADIFRRLGSDFEGERNNAATAMWRCLNTNGISFNDLAILIESHRGEIEELKYSDADAAAFYQKGIEKGQAQARESGSSDFWNGGEPQWAKIAMWCQERSARLNSKEQDFIDSVTARTQFREPSDKQKPWLLSIFFRLGGKREAAI